MSIKVPMIQDFQVTVDFEITPDTAIYDIVLPPLDSEEGVVVKHIEVFPPGNITVEQLNALLGPGELEIIISDKVYDKIPLRKLRYRGTLGIETGPWTLFPECEVRLRLTVKPSEEITFGLWQIGLFGKKRVVVIVK